MKLKKYIRQGGRMVEYRLLQGIVSMSFIAYSGYPRKELACALKAMRSEVRKQVERMA